LSLIFLLSPLAILGKARVSHAQDTAADLAIRGVVFDSSHSPIPGARVEARSTAGQALVTGTTDKTGTFVLRVRGGDYDLRISAPGFAVLEQRLTATPVAAEPVEFTVQLPGVREDVTVTGASGYQAQTINTATKTPTPLIDVPQSVTVVPGSLITDQMMMSVGDVMRYVPGVTVHQGENNRDQVIIRGNSSSADFFVDGVRDDVQYYRDLYNQQRVEALKGPNAMIFGRGGGGGVVNRVSKVADFGTSREFSLQGGMFGNRRVTAGINQPLNDAVSFRVDGMFENSDSFRDFVALERGGVTPTATIRAGSNTTVTLRYE